VLPLALYALYLFLQQQESEEHRRTTEFASDVQPVREWLRLALGLGWIVLGVEALVRSALWLGDAFDIPDFFWGATVVAASTSLPDALVSVRAARRAESEVSLANVFGSNTFDLLVAVPAGVLVAGTAVVHLEFAVPMFGFLAAATLALFVSLRVGLSLGRREAWFLLALYAVFAGWLGLEAAGVIGWTSSGR
jgi:cation:H+ antiporter